MVLMASAEYVARQNMNTVRFTCCHVSKEARCLAFRNEGDCSRSQINPGEEVLCVQAAVAHWQDWEKEGESCNLKRDHMASPFSLNV